MIATSITIPIESFLLCYGLGLSLAYFSGRESGQAKEQRLRRVAVDDAFRRGKASGYGFLDAISSARTDAMSGMVVNGHATGGNVTRPYDWGTAVELFDYEKEMEA